MLYIIDINNPKTDIPLGKQGENKARTFGFDISAWVREFGLGNPVLTHCIEGVTYPCATEFDGSVVVWIVTSSDTAFHGYGKMELTYTVDDVVVKSRTWSTVCTKPLDEPGEAPDPWKGFVEVLAKQGEAAVAKAELVAAELLERAERGDFTGPKGDPGYTPVKGVDYFDGEIGLPGKPGKDGYTPVKGVDYFDGAPGKDGEDGRTPVKGVDYFDGAPGLRGEPGRRGEPGPEGKPGYTPVKGVDYFDGKPGADGAPGKDGHTPTDAELTALIEPLVPAPYDDTSIRGLIAGKADSGHKHKYGDLTEIPTTFTPATHTHPSTAITYGRSLPYTIVANSYISNVNGSSISYNGWDETGFIDVSGVDKVFTNAVGQYNAWYKPDKTFLSNATFTANTGLDVPSGAKYIKLSQSHSIMSQLTVTTSVDTLDDELQRIRESIPEPVTDSHINDLIDAKLGVIENGTY